MLAREGAASPWPRYSERTGLACAACHVTNDGGDLTAFGRSMRFNSLLLDARDPMSGAAPSTGGDDAEAATTPWAYFSGELSLFARTGRELVQGQHTTLTSLTESLRLDASQIGGDEALSFHGEGLARSTFSNGPEGVDGSAARLTTAELDWAPRGGDVSMRLGRQFVVAGVVARAVDGLSLHATPSSLVELDAIGGVPSDNGFGGSAGDLFVGGRAGLVAGREFRGGFSAFYSKDNGDPSDLRAGFDADLAPAKELELLGHVFYDWIGDRIYDERVHALYKPTIAWEYALDWSRTVPGLFFPKDSIFSVFSVDTIDELALTATRRFDERRSARGFVRETWYQDGDSATQIGGGLDVRYGPNGEDTVGAELYDQHERRHDLGGSSVDGDAVFARAYHSLFWTATIYSAEEVDLNLYASDASGRNARLVRLLVGWRPVPRADFEIGAEEVRNPEFESRLDLFAQVNWRF